MNEISIPLNFLGRGRNVITVIIHSSSPFLCQYYRNELIPRKSKRISFNAFRLKLDESYPGRGRSFTNKCSQSSELGSWITILQYMVKDGLEKTPENH